MAAYEVKTPELRAQLLMDRVVNALQDAVREAEVFGDPAPSDYALDKAQQLIKKVVTFEPSMGVKTPVIGVDSRGRIEIRFLESPDGSNVFVWIDSDGNGKGVVVKDGETLSFDTH